MTTATYEHLTIVGSDGFVACIRAALDLLRPLPSWRYIKGLRRIAANAQPRMYFCERTRTCFIPEYSVLTSIGNNGADYVACQLVHEGAHSIDTRPCKSRSDLYNAEVFAFTAQLESLYEMGAKSNLTDYVEAALKDPLGHYGPGAVDALVGGRRRILAVMLFIVASLAGIYVWAVVNFLGL